MQYDYIIVGGGSAGCVLANRLSSNASRVLLIEAGQDTPPANVPDDIQDGNPTRAYFNPRYQWPNLNATLVANGRPTHYEQARVMGGGSSINAQVANRGAPSDYDDWATHGALGWGWSDVLPYFRKLESDRDFAGELHGKDGPLPISRVRQEEWSGFIRGLTQAYEAVGLHLRQDFNGAYGDGYSPVPLTNSGGRRASTAIAYLTEEVRARPDLTILADTYVTEIVFSGAVATGVVAVNRQGEQRFEGREIILSAGALHSPAILMRSGVGPAEQLSRLGIEVRADVAAVGQGLQEHPSIAVSAYLRPEHRMAPNVSGHIQVHARYSSNYPGCPASDMAISAVAKSAWHPLGQRLGSIQLWVNKTYSRGSVTLNNRNAYAEPNVSFGWLSDARDMVRLKQGLRFLNRILSTGSMPSIALDPFPSAWNARAKSVSTISRLNFAITSGLAALMDSSPVVRRALVRHVITQGDSLAFLAADETALERYIWRNVSGNWHPTSTCRMGPPTDPTCVTDPQGRVRGVGGLRVVDASVMPFCPRANTNLPTIMVAEKMADAILAGAAA